MQRPRQRQRQRKREKTYTQTLMTTLSSAAPIVRLQARARSMHRGVKTVRCAWSSPGFSSQSRLSPSSGSLGQQTRKADSES